MAIYDNVQPWRDQFLFNGEQSGDLGTWGSSSSLTASRSYHMAVVAKGFVFVFQGINSSYTALNTIIRAPIGTDGIVGTFVDFGTVPATVTAPARYNAQAVLLNDVIYIVGGRTSDGSIASVIACPVNSDGSLGTWFNATSLPGVIRNQAVCCTKNTILSIGGYGTSTSDAIYHAPVDSETGEIGVWVTDSVSLPAARYAGAACIIGDSLYYIGGFNASSVQQASIYRATVDESGAISAFSTYGVALPEGVAHHQLVVTGNTVYVIGGEQKTTVYKSTIGADNSLGTFTTCPNLPAIRSVSPAIVTSSKLCLLGGFSSSGFFATSISTPFAGGHNDYTGFDATEEIIPNSGAISVDEDVDSTYALSYTWNVGKIVANEDVDSISMLSSTGAAFFIINEDIDDVTSSGWTSIAGKFSNQDEIDFVIAYGYTSNVGKISAIEDVDSINVLSIEDGLTINGAINIDEYIDRTNLSASNYSHRIYVDDGEDDISVIASTWNVGIIKVREYFDVVSSQMVRGESRGTASIIEAVDSVYAVAITSNVGKVSITCGINDIGAVATNEQINVGVVNLAEYVDNVLSNAVICIGATISAAEAVDEIKSTVSSGSHGTVLIHEEPDVVKSSTKIIMSSLGFSRTLIGQLGIIQAQPIGALRFDRGSIEYENASTPLPINPIHFTR